jgi:hypothetical protein
MPVALESLVLTTLTSFAIEASLRTSTSVELTEVIADTEGAPLQRPSATESE